MKAAHALLLLLSLSVASGGAAAADDSSVRAVHERVLTLDSHVDIPLSFATSAHLPHHAQAQVNLQRMRTGALDAAFFIVYVGQGARTEAGYLGAKADALAKFDAIERMVALYPREIGLATTAAEVRRLHEEGKLVALIGVENAFALGTDLSLVAEFARRGARYMTLVHNGHNDVGDSAQPLTALGDGAEEHGGLSELGERLVEEMNRHGLLVDVSHVSRQTMLDATRLSRAPVIASHSSVMALAEHPRNLDDEQLIAIRDNGGVVQVVAFDIYLREGGGASLSDFVDHIEHAIAVMGIEHVGISSDFGGGGGVPGWQHAAETGNVTREFLRRGYSEEDISLLWSGNLLRVMAEAESIAAAE